MTSDDPEPEPDPRRGPDRRDRDPMGELLPESTRDESAAGWGDEDDTDPDGHLRREVPPHHG